MIELRQITENNFEECIKLNLKDKQWDYIATNAYSLSQAYAVQNDGLNKPMPYAIYNDEIMVDKRYQGNGYGKDAMKKIIELVKTFPYGNAESFILCCSKENKIAYALYKSLGFVDTEAIDEDGDQICRLDLFNSII